MKELTQSELRELLILNEQTGAFYRRKTSGNAYRGDIAGGRRPDGRWRISIAGRSYLRSRLVYLYVHGWMPKEVDHRDRNKSNDRPDNLRAATRSQNNANRLGLVRDLPKGVCYQPSICRSKPFVAYLKSDRRTKNLGGFLTPELAHQAYLEAAREVFGDFACGT
jgi:hypothetical protein